MLASSPTRVAWFAIGRAALGVLLVRVNAADADTNAILAQLYQHVTARKGTLVVLRGFANRDVGAIAETDRALRTVMEAVKARFDPKGVLPALP
jgi:hypothetical protein